MTKNSAAQSHTEQKIAIVDKQSCMIFVAVVACRDVTLSSRWKVNRETIDSINDCLPNQSETTTGCETKTAQKSTSSGKDKIFWTRNNACLCWEMTNTIVQSWKFDKQDPQLKRLLQLQQNTHKLVQRRPQNMSKCIFGPHSCRTEEIAPLQTNITNVHFEVKTFVTFCNKRKLAQEGMENVASVSLHNHHFHSCASNFRFLHSS